MCPCQASELQCTFFSDRRSYLRSRVVATTPPGFLRPPSPIPSGQSHIGIRCLQEGLRSLCPGLQRVDRGGPWAPEDTQFHINYLELKAAFLALQAFAQETIDLHIQLFMDNRMAVAYLNRMGGTHSQLLCDMAKAVWEWCLERAITVHAEHLAGSSNTTADNR